MTAGEPRSPKPGDRLAVEVCKWPDRVARRTNTVVLGSDEHGLWLGNEPPRDDAHDVPFVFLLPDGAPFWIARHFADGGWKLDVCTPTAWEEGLVRVVDLDLDVRRLHGRTWVEDEDEFAQRCGAYPDDLVAAARATTTELESRLMAFDPTFGPVADYWLARHLATRSRRATAAVFFDMGGVLLEHTGDHALDAWCQRLGIDDATLKGEIGSAIGPGWEGGRLPDEITERLAAKLEITSPQADQLLGDLHTDERLAPRLLAFARRLPDWVEVGIVSNNGPDVRRHWRRCHDIEELFWPIVISGEERIAKPNPVIYRVAAARAGVPLDRCAFVDDRQINVEGAVAAGMTGIRHLDGDSTIVELDAWLAGLGSGRATVRSE